jgi:hypothetical protein
MNALLSVEGSLNSLFVAVVGITGFLHSISAAAQQVTFRFVIPPDGTVIVENARNEITETKLGTTNSQKEIRETKQEARIKTTDQGSVRPSLAKSILRRLRKITWSAR